MAPSTSNPPDEEPTEHLRGLSFSLVGPGRVGRSLAHWWTACGASLQSVVGRDPGRVDSLVTSLRASTNEPAGLAGADFLVLAVPDPELDAVSDSLAEKPLPPIVFHTSGSRGAEALSSLSGRGSAVGSLHPLKAFPRPLPALSDAADTFFALDGDAIACELGSRLADAVGGHSAVVSGPDRLTYHLAATLAAGGVTALVATACQLTRALDLPEAVEEGLLALARGALDGLEPDAPLGSAITGPVPRGEIELVLRQLEVLEEAHPTTHGLVMALARQTLALLKQDKPWDQRQSALAQQLGLDTGHGR